MHFRGLASGVLLAALAGCSFIYKPDVHQGNLLDKATVETLKPGMTKQQVQLVMGTPAVVSPFDQDRWDYVSSVRRGRGALETKDLVLTFENDVLAKIEGDFLAENPDQLVKDARKYKRQYPDEKIPDDEKKKKRRDQG